MARMGETNITKCTECNSRDLDKDEIKGEVVCNDCGTVLDEMQIDYNHPSTQVGENAHISSTKNDSLGSRTTRRTIIDRKEARKAGMGNLIRAEQKAHAKKNVRGHDILDKIKELSNSESVIKAAEDVIKACFTKNPEYDGYGELPLNQMRFMFSEQGKDADYVISVCAVGTKKMLSDFGRIGFYNWQEDAKKLGLEANDVLVASKIITERIKRICRGANLNPYGKIQLRRSRALYAFEQKLRHCIREKKVANAESLLEWVTERIHALDNDGDGPMSDIRPNMLLAMITICGLEEFKECKMTKKGVAEIFNLTVGGVNAKLKKDAPDTTNIKSFIKNFNRRTGVA
tara:strand:+ start:1251 stop:2285 length:1035 start_codon:yes stop_codon:yes gene_type:complete